MAKYTFSQGKIMVEDGVYMPLFTHDRRLSRGTVVALMARLSRDEELGIESRDKENARVQFN